MLTGQSKTDYQRAYMRRRGSNAEARPATVRPIVLDPVRPAVKPRSVRPVRLEGAELRAYMAGVSIAEIEQQGYTIPNWRREQG